MATQRTKVKFSQLIGSLDIDRSMFVLDWMLKTGRPYTKKCGKWDTKGVSQFLYAYSANELNAAVFSIPSDRELFFDAVFGRAIYKKASYDGIDLWRAKERIRHDSYRMFDIPVPEYKRDGRYKFGDWECLNALFGMDGKVLRSGMPCQEKEDTKLTVVRQCEIYTYGNGWHVRFKYTFPEYDARYNYWYLEYWQKPGQAILDFLNEVIVDMEDNKICRSGEENG